MQSIYQNFINPRITNPRITEAATEDLTYRDIAAGFEPLFQLTFAYFDTFQRKLSEITHNIMALKDLQDMGNAIPQSRKQEIVGMINKANEQIERKATELGDALKLISSI